MRFRESERQKRTMRERRKGGKERGIGTGGDGGGVHKLQDNKHRQVEKNDGNDERSVMRGGRHERAGMKEGRKNRLGRQQQQQQLW